MLGDGCAGPPKPFQPEASFLTVCLTDGLNSEFAGMFSNDGPLSGNAAKKTD
jgi:hypothetical protein